MATELEEKSQVKAKFSRNLATVRDDLMELGSLVAAAMEQSVRAVLTRDGDLARRVITGDLAVNSLEEAIDRECVRLIALFQPVAGDLRQLMAVDHIITELERIGDSATNIAEEVLTLGQLPPRAIHPRLEFMAQSVQEMVRQSLEAFFRSNATWPGRSVWRMMTWMPWTRPLSRTCSGRWPGPRGPSCPARARSTSCATWSG